MTIQRLLAMSWFRRLIWPFVIVAILGFSLKSCVNRFQLGFVPTAFEVSEISYSQDESSGFGPGGNESGVVVYRLPDKTIASIRTRGIEYLHSVSESNMVRTSDDHRRIYDDWKATPLVPSDGWQCQGSECASPEKTSVENFLWKYGFGITLPTQILRDIDHVISTSGSYYARGRTGTLILAPEVGKAFFVFSG